MNAKSPAIRMLSSAAFAALICATGANALAAPSSTTSIVVTSDPTTVSVSRVDGPTFFVKYTVTVTNNSSNNNLTYDFKGTTKVTLGNVPVNNTYAQFVSSTGVPCTVPDPTTPTVVTCSKLSVNKGTSKSFTLTYKTPVSGDKLRLTIESTSNAIKGSGYVDTTLITIPYEQTIVGFKTYVPPEGGTFYTGANGNWSGSPGAPAIPSDPWTTTIVIPPIGFSTTATVAEKQNGELSGCSGTYYVVGGCFDSNLEMPSAPGAIQTMTIYLRVDATKINLLGTSINDAVIKYAKDGVNFTPVLPCSQTGGPTSGNPCMGSRRAYGNTSDIPAVWQLDWEFVVWAVDNGRYIN
jgi:hypothetical protein